MWDDNKVAILQQLWNEGKSASEIARTLGEPITRNAVIGKAHRLGLQSRPSPVIRDTRATILTLNDRMCKWPFGHPGEASFHFCGKKSGPNTSYCGEHTEQAYRPGTSLDEILIARRVAARLTRHLN